MSSLTHASDSDIDGFMYCSSAKVGTSGRTAFIACIARAVHRERKQPAGRSNDVWGDLFTRECLAIEVGFSLRAEHVVAAVNRLELSRGLRSGFPAPTVRSSQVESFNGKFREECLNAHRFESVQDARRRSMLGDAIMMNISSPFSRGSHTSGICDEGDRIGGPQTRLLRGPKFPGRSRPPSSQYQLVRK